MFDYPFQNPDLELEVRINNLISRLTLTEKVQLMKHESPGVLRLRVPAYDWWNETLGSIQIYTGGGQPGMSEGKSGILIVKGEPYSIF